MINLISIFFLGVFFFYLLLIIIFYYRYFWRIRVSCTTILKMFVSFAILPILVFLRLMVIHYIIIIIHLAVYGTFATDSKQHLHNITYII